jgi:adenylate cyclase
VKKYYVSGAMEQVGNTAKIVVAPEGKPETVIELGERLTIGRSTANQLVLEDHKASRSHAEIRNLGAGRYRLSDLGSANGTWLNGRRVSVPKELEDGDQIVIGSVMLRFVAAVKTEAPVQRGETATGTALFMRSERIVILVADIRNYTTMSEALPNREFSRLISEWFREASDLIEENNGTIDKFIGDAVMAYWVSVNRAESSREINSALLTTRGLMDKAAKFSSRLEAEFPAYTFRIGVALNAGEAMLGNVGTGENQSFTVVGDSVNVAFRLESLTKEKMSPVIVSRSVVESADPGFRFRDLGLAEVKGRKEPVSIWALELS